VVGEPIQVYTSLIVREDAMTLVGFMTKEERDLFNILQSASGVGVKVALALLSTLSVSEIVQAVVSANYKPLTAAKGVGPKLAQKMTLELKEKMADWREYALECSQQIIEGGAHVPDSEAYIEAETVLLSLGYTQDEVMRSLSAVHQESTEKSLNSEEILRDALRWLSRV
jgi:Holliday junction DNA helicase RuvA